MDIEEATKSVNTDVRDNESGRLAYHSSKSDTIHIYQCDDEFQPTYKWSACNNGGRKDTPLRLTEDEIGENYLIRDGTVVAKICGNCSRMYDPDAGGRKT